MSLSLSLRRVSALTAVAVLGVLAQACASEPAVTEPDLEVSLAKAKAPSTADSTVLASFQLSSTGALTGDGLFGSAYTHNKCGVIARVFGAISSPSSSGSKDANMQTANTSAGDRKCVGYGSSAVPRKVTVTYPDGGTETLPTTINVRDAMGITIGASELRQMSITLNGSTRCARLNFGNAAGGTMVTVTRVAAKQWLVSATAATAACGLNIPSPEIGPFTFSFTVNAL